MEPLIPTRKLPHWNLGIKVVKYMDLQINVTVATQPHAALFEDLVPPNDNRSLKEGIVLIHAFLAIDNHVNRADVST